MLEVTIKPPDSISQRHTCELIFFHPSLGFITLHPQGEDFPIASVTLIRETPASKPRRRKSRTT